MSTHRLFQGGNGRQDAVHDLCSCKPSGVYIKEEVLFNNIFLDWAGIIKMFLSCLFPSFLRERVDFSELITEVSFKAASHTEEKLFVVNQNKAG